MDSDDGLFEESEKDDSAEELLDQAQSNAQALVMATIAFLSERGVPIDDWTASVGRTFTNAWDEPQSWDADEFMEAMLINFRSLGAEVVSSSLTPEWAEAITVGFPDPGLCAIFGVEPSSVARFNDAAGAIARHCGLAWEWSLDGDQTRYIARRATTG